MYIRTDYSAAQEILIQVCCAQPHPNFIVDTKWPESLWSMHLILSTAQWLTLFVCLSMHCFEAVPCLYIPKCLSMLEKMYRACVDKTYCLKPQCGDFRCRRWSGHPGKYTDLLTWWQSFFSLLMHKLEPPMPFRMDKQCNFV